MKYNVAIFKSPVFIFASQKSHELGFNNKSMVHIYRQNVGSIKI